METATTVQALTSTTHPAVFARVHAAGILRETLTALGNTNLLSNELHKTCVTGARACTSYGAEITSSIVAGLTPGRVLVTGGSYGIDAEAIRTALATDRRVILVTPGGPDCPFPAAHAELHQRILDQEGLILSAQPAGTLPIHRRNLERNELMVAISDTVIIAEAGTRSGSVHTAHTARQLGRPLGAVPGPVTSAASAGTNELIRTGIAALVSNAQDVNRLRAPRPAPRDATT